MFARRLNMQLKPNTVGELTKVLESQVIPTLRAQRGFRDELVFIGPNAKEAFAISLWDAKENAESYGRDRYPEIAKALSRVVEGTPQLQTYEVLTSTVQNRQAGMPA
jgi:hypothetical protein